MIPPILAPYIEALGNMEAGTRRPGGWSLSPIAWMQLRAAAWEWALTIEKPPTLLGLPYRVVEGWKNGFVLWNADDWRTRQPMGEK